MVDMNRSSLPEGPAEVPEIVGWAEKYLRKYRKRLGIVGGGWIAACFAANGVLGVFLPPSFLVVPLVGAVGVYFQPLTRNARKAKEVVRRWDLVEIERGFDQAGAPSDPRLELAQAMTARILGHASVEPGLEPVVQGLLEGLRASLHDLRTLQLARETGASGGHADEHAEEVMEQVQVRVARVLGSLAELHGAVATRDAAALAIVSEEAEELLAHLTAEKDVELMLRAGRDASGI